MQSSNYLLFIIFKHHYFLFILQFRTVPQSILKLYVNLYDGMESLNGETNKFLIACKN